jgi:hypothetical protein
MSAASRKTSRKALGALLKSGLEGAGKLAQSVYDHPPAELTSSPVIFVRSARTKTKRRGIGQTKGFNTFRLEILACVVSANTDASWDGAAAADALDDLEAGIREIIQINPTNAAWANLKSPEDEETQITYLPGNVTGGLPYDVEIIPVEVEVYDT